LIDYEVGHYGDPAFDLGFFASHLVLKAFYRAPNQGPYLDLLAKFWRQYRADLAPRTGNAELLELEQRAVWNTAGCLLARLHGKSPIDYLQAADRRAAVERLAESFLTGDSASRSWDLLLAAADQEQGASGG